MLVNCDVKGLEVSCAAFLSKDPVLTKELMEDEDIHENNRLKFEFPTRLIAKTFIFRIIYGGSCFSFANDPDFMSISKKPVFWQNAIDNFYEKYKGLNAWHLRLVNQVMLSGVYRSPTGREYKFQPYKNKKGEMQWPRTNILNYPVQGLGADLVAIMRVSLWNRIRKLGCKHILPVATVHDSILLDISNSAVDHTVKLIQDVSRDVPGNFLKLFGSKYSLPFNVEITVGNDYSNMEAVK
jgi:DNA polymerase I-like protein with 3'-5' exonuclease and polymerase domains